MTEQVEKDLTKEWEQLLKEVVEVPLYHPDNASVTLRRIMWFFQKHDEKIFITNNLIEETLFYKIDLFSSAISFYTRGGLVVQFSVVYPSFKTEPPRPRVNIYSLHAPLEV